MTLGGGEIEYKSETDHQIHCSHGLLRNPNLQDVILQSARVVFSSSEPSHTSNSKQNKHQVWIFLDQQQKYVNEQHPFNPNPRCLFILPTLNFPRKKSTCLTAVTFLPANVPWILKLVHHFLSTRIPGKS